MKKIVAFLLTLSCLLTNLTAQNAPKRLVVLDPSIVEMVYMVGAQDQLVAISTLQFSKIWPEDQTVKLYKAQHRANLRTKTGSCGHELPFGKRKRKPC